MINSGSNGHSGVEKSEIDCDHPFNLNEIALSLHNARTPYIPRGFGDERGNKIRTLSSQAASYSCCILEEIDGEVELKKITSVHKVEEGIIGELALYVLINNCGDRLYRVEYKWIHEFEDSHLALWEYYQRMRQENSAEYTRLRRSRFEDLYLYLERCFSDIK